MDAYIHSFERRMKLCKDKEMKFWNELDEKYMTEEESDDNDVSVLLQHKPSWRSESNYKFPRGGPTRYKCY